MKKFLSFLLVTGFAAASYADIQDPPAHEQGPTRKLGRAISNITCAITELPYTIEVTNELEGNSAAGGYGIAKGFYRMVYRYSAGWAELFTFAVPSYKGSYRPFYRSDIPWVNGGFTEFAPELGFETKYHYTRLTDDY